MKLETSYSVGIPNGQQDFDALIFFYTTSERLLYIVILPHIEVYNLKPNHKLLIFRSLIKWYLN